jgi:hypothetical protein
MPPWEILLMTGLWLALLIALGRDIDKQPETEDENHDDIDHGDYH